MIGSDEIHKYNKQTLAALIDIANNPNEDPIFQADIKRQLLEIKGEIDKILRRYDDGN